VDGQLWQQQPQELAIRLVKRKRSRRAKFKPKTEAAQRGGEINELASEMQLTFWLPSGWMGGDGLADKVTGETGTEDQLHGKKNEICAGQVEILLTNEILKLFYFHIGYI